MFQRASTDISMSDRSSDDRPTIISRFEDERGWSMTGGRETFGRAWACVNRSLTIWRARIGSVPGSKVRTIDDRLWIDSDWIESSQATPLSRSASSGTVMSCSTSSAESPRASVWTSTYGGENSGTVSTGALGSRAMPRTRAPAAMPSTRSRNLRLVSMMRRIDPTLLGVSSRACGTAP